jgi:elongation factor 1 alpha-like protein
MSRHEKFYSDMKRGAHTNNYDDDDYYDDDDDYYDDDALQYVVKPKPAAKAAPAPKQGAKGPPQAKPPAVDDLGLAVGDADYELLRPIVETLKNALGATLWKSLPVARVVTAIRDSNYSADDAAASLLAAPKQPAPVAASPKATVGATVAAKQSGKGKTLKLGGDTSAISPQNVPALTPSPVKGHADPTQQLAPQGSDNLPLYKTDSEKRRAEMSPMGSAQASFDSTVGEEIKPALSVVIAGHVDSGKSTILGHLLLQLGHFSARDVEKLERQGRQTGKASFKYAWLLDQSEEERRRGITIDAAPQTFETATRRVSVLDAPGHKDFVLNMITSATQADTALLVVTGAPGEFESGLQHGTREHLLILRTLGVTHLIVVINKMDVFGFSKERYDDVCSQLLGLVKQSRYKQADVLAMCPVSGLSGVNLVERDGGKEMPWYNGPSLVEAIDSAPMISRALQGPLRCTVTDASKSGQLTVKVESGTVGRGDTIILMPCKVCVTVRGVDVASAGSVQRAKAGDVADLSTSSDLVGVYVGCVGCPPKDLVRCSCDFEAHIQTFPSLEKPVLPGSTFTMAVHAVAVPVVVERLISKQDKQGAWSAGMVKCIPKESQALVLLRTEFPIALELASTNRALGRFVLRQNGETVAGGLVKNVLAT